MKLNFIILVVLLSLVMPCIGLVHSSILQRNKYTSFINNNHKFNRQMSNNNNNNNNNDNDNDDVEGDLNNEVFMELIANQKKVRHNKKQNKIKIQPIGPEFSRIVNIEQVPEKRPVLCKLVAKESERKALANRFDLPNLAFFAANVTISKTGVATVLVEGSLEALITSPIMEEGQKITTEFDTILLNNIGASEKLSFDDNTDYDDEINANGDIDVGEIASQYLGMELL